MTEREHLIRGLGPWGAASLVVGTIIGTGVFLKTAVMAQLGGSSAWVLLAWLVAGVLSLAGAMTYAELGAMFPAAGGEYVYLRRGYGPFAGYLYAWNRFWIATPGSIAAYAVGSASFVAAISPMSELATQWLATGFVIAFTALNCMNVRTGGRLQTALTVLKVAMIAAFAVGAFLSSTGSVSGATAATSGTGGFPGWSAFGAMVVAGLWAYDGWNNLPMAAGEVRDPQRNVPRAIVGGALVVFAIYALINLGYFYALSFEDVATSRSNDFPDAPAVAARAAGQAFGATTAGLLAVAMTISALSAMNGSMLTGARVPYAVARDRLAPRALGGLSAGAHVPLTAVVVQGVLGVGFAWSGRFDELTDAVVFVSWLFYALNAGTVILLRVREPSRPRPFRVPGFPVVPILFIVVAVLLIANTIYAQFRLSMFGLGVTALGGAVYVIWLRGKAAPLTDSAID